MQAFAHQGQMQTCCQQTAFKEMMEGLDVIHDTGCVIDRKETKQSCVTLYGRSEINHSRKVNDIAFTITTPHSFEFTKTLESIHLLFLML